MGGYSDLPHIPLPKFSGYSTKWQTCLQLFTELVDKDALASEAVKLQRLKKCLTEEAALMLEDVPITTSNYAETWKEIQLQFHNP